MTEFLLIRCRKFFQYIISISEGETKKEKEKRKVEAETKVGETKLVHRILGKNENPIISLVKIWFSLLSRRTIQFHTNDVCPLKLVTSNNRMHTGHKLCIFVFADTTLRNF